MKTIFNRRQPDSEAIVDEVVGVTHAVTIDGSPYYRGWLVELADPAVYGSDSPTYGLWTAAAKGGTRYTVLASGLPGANQVLLDISSGEVIASASVTLYARYLGYGRLSRVWEGVAVNIALPGFLDDESGRDVYSQEVPYATRFGGAKASCAYALGADLVLTIDKAGGEGAESETVTISSGQTEGTATWASGLQFAAGEHIVVSVPAQSAGAVDVQLHLWRA